MDTLIKIGDYAFAKAQKKDDLTTIHFHLYYLR